jgi:uncharacterized protein (TIGR00251 family)
MFISVKVVPNSKNPEIEKIGDGKYRVRVDEKAESGKANMRLVEMLAEHFKVPKSSVFISKGVKSRNKIIEIR